MEPPSAELSWVSDARVAGFETFAGDPAVDARLDVFAAAHVSVVVIDSDLSFYMTDARFEESAAYIEAVAKKCHERGMKAVAYCSLLEALTENAASVPNTMWKDHPDWVQRGIDGKANKFVGGAGRAFWVPAGTESAWLCPTSGYRDYFINRVKRLAQTSLDGLWGDVPLLSDIVGVWPCTNASCAAKFLAETGLAQPTRVDWNNPVFRRWVAWRHGVIHEFEQAVLAGARTVRPDFQLIVETDTMDHSGGTVQGLDGASRDDGDVLRVWEVSTASDETGMREAPADDWISMAIMMRHGRGCAGKNPSWVISYGKETDDAERVMAIAIAGGVRPYESQIPLLNNTVGDAWRGKMYGWLKDNNDIWAGESANPVAVIFSSVSRDFIDRNAGGGLYTSTNRADEDWWATTPTDSAKNLPYLGEYRGICKALIHAHAPYDVVTMPHLSPAWLAPYPVVVAPRPAALSDGEIASLKSYVEAGGTLLVTGGTDAGLFDEHGVLRAQPALLQAFGVSAGANWSRTSYGLGAVVLVTEQVGQTYYQTTDASVTTELARILEAAGRTIVTDAPPAVVIDLRQRTEHRLDVLFANIDGLDTGGFTAESASFQVAIPCGGKMPRRVTVTQPGDAAPAEIPFTHEGGRAVFDVTVGALLLARIALT
ncbi:beta-galactosidase trimerization domain-containing protein [Pseudarthrobacter sulfonivorans]|uniref:beta-galactosidase trimerization domain-containing protein n=1 Tax=Pseudarthrobacter sulfonivorans TaxID=121292 RepID=UPI00285E696B|nr:beta-galactosidase trimerization domain-containing protein [Pseudarthrobacter sulfonivorans]MDR6417196.1 hypothetical protein [Pseudarthrobacter sulfonivorans]